ncbi:hypothetical protein ACIOEX_11035 [Streptomyces sp. NPDC087850]|uniref:hypothetical protein n=1 Tax=Streptomyces sp. NPDC087850 TaxID=3365809 RepID=UPI00380B646B
MSEETVTYWEWTVRYDTEMVYAGTSESRGVARDFLPDALLPGLLKDLCRHYPHLHGRAPHDWSASELSKAQFRQRQAELLREMVDASPPGPTVPRTAVVGLLLGICLLVLAGTLPSGPVFTWLLSTAGVLSWITGGTSLIMSGAFRSPTGSGSGQHRGERCPPRQQDC